MGRAAWRDVVDLARAEVLRPRLHRECDAVGGFRLPGPGRRLAVGPQRGPGAGGGEEVDKVAGAVDDGGADGGEGVDDLGVGAEVLAFVLVAHLVPLEHLPGMGFHLSTCGRRWAGGEGPRCSAGDGVTTEEKSRNHRIFWNRESVDTLGSRLPSRPILIFCLFAWRGAHLIPCLDLDVPLYLDLILTSSLLRSKPKLDESTQVTWDNRSIASTL